MAAHILHGTARMDRHAGRIGEVSVTQAVGKCPSWMPKEGRKIWKELTGLGQYGQILMANHRSGFEHYCWLEARLKAEQGIKHDGETLKALSASETQMLHSMRMQIAGYPAANAKVRIPEKPKANKWELIKQGPTPTVA